MLQHQITGPDNLSDIAASIGGEFIETRTGDFSFLAVIGKRTFKVTCKFICDDVATIIPAHSYTA